jgi:alpha-L-fucosidase
MWDSRNVTTTWQWNVMDIGPRRDVLGEFVDALRNVHVQTSPFTQQPIQVGIYHSLYEWFNPIYLHDKAQQFTTTQFVDWKIIPELYDLVHKYQPTLLWSDGQWEAHSDYWKAREFLHWYSTKSSVAPHAVWNDRWGNDTMCQHGAFVTCSDRYHPDQTMTKKWEKCLSIDKTSWGYNRKSNLQDYLTTQEVIHELIITVAQNGNLLLNIGPASGGNIPTIFQDRLHDIGTWLQVNGPAIYSTTPWSVCTNDTATSTVYYTQRRDPQNDDDTTTILYAHLTEWPSHQIVNLACLVEFQQESSSSSSLWIEMLGVPDTPLEWKVDPIQNTVQISLPLLTPDKIPCQHAWVLAIRTTTTTTGSTSSTSRNDNNLIRTARSYN